MGQLGGQTPQVVQTTFVRRLGLEFGEAQARELAAASLLGLQRDPRPGHELAWPIDDIWVCYKPFPTRPAWTGGFGRYVHPSHKSVG